MTISLAPARRRWPAPLPQPPARHDPHRPLNDMLLTAGAIGLAIAIAMVFTVWRIRRIQYPPELQWPSDRERRRRHRHRDRSETND